MIYQSGIDIHGFRPSLGVECLDDFVDDTYKRYKPPDILMESGLTDWLAFPISSGPARLSTFSSGWTPKNTGFCTSHRFLALEGQHQPQCRSRMLVFQKTWRGSKFFTPNLLCFITYGGYTWVISAQTYASVFMHYVYIILYICYMSQLCHIYIYQHATISWVRWRLFLSHFHQGQVDPWGS